MGNISNFFRGDTKIIKLTFLNEDDTPFDLTGCVVYFTLKANPYTSDDLALIRKDISAHIDPVNGKTEIVLTPQDTDISPDIYYYDIQIKTSNGEIYTVDYGTVNIIQDITQRND